MGLVWCAHAILTELKSMRVSPQAIDEMRLCVEMNQSMLCKDPLFSSQRQWVNLGPFYSGVLDFTAPSVACRPAPENLLEAMISGVRLCALGS